MHKLFSCKLYYAAVCFVSGSTNQIVFQVFGRIKKGIKKA